MIFSDLLAIFSDFSDSLHCALYHNPRALTLDTYDTKAEHQVAIDLPTRSHLVAGRYEICHNVTFSKLRYSLILRILRWILRWILRCFDPNLVSGCF